VAGATGAPGTGTIDATALHRFVVVIGDNVTKEFTINHNFGTTDVSVWIYEENYQQVFARVVPYVFVPGDSLNNIRLQFTHPPTTDEYRVIVYG
jgi:hypothetical protein